MSKYSEAVRQRPTGRRWFVGAEMTALTMQPYLGLCGFLLLKSMVSGLFAGIGSNFGALRRWMADIVPSRLQR